ncbi:phosphonopyruvate decarboxylase [Micromonospora sp. KC207]|uniref:phosphonopyruvate decarboxylase n=1 Tax=Micromonospora sp. KC207 TaxID=2530377 RepID=UPI0010482AC6|nr:phosphonopyruvate decarboxylase [Micromonospora sp. KC207]TDC65376.1 phosphonopyruvate decarboxylase [Micromonospora sp. KC207]
MISAGEFCGELRRRRVGFVTGVPCSYFNGPIALLERQPSGYVAAANEGAALAMAAGAELRGVRSAVLVQNSGFGNLVNPLTSLLDVFAVPVLVFMSLRGWPDPDGDEPQHAVMGRTGHALLDVLGVPHWTLRPTVDSLRDLLDRADNARQQGRAAWILVPKGSVGEAPGEPGPEPAFRRREALAALLPHVEHDIVYATTGFISRELSGLADRPLNFYVAGSMGHALALGLGTALHEPRRRVIVLDGDGAALMHLGTAATVGAYAPPNLLHVVLDNHSYESTGAQRTTSASMRWTDLGRGLGYRTVAECSDGDAVRGTLRAIAAQDGPHLVVVHIGADRATTPPRVTRLGTPPELAARFRAAVAEPD